MVVDYGNKMLEGINNCQFVMSQSAHYLLTSSKAFFKANLDQSWFDLDDLRESHDSLPRQTVIQIGDPDIPSRLVTFNSHAKFRYT